LIGAGVSNEACIPLGIRAWYDDYMSGTYTVVVGDRGRLVVPAEVRERSGLVEGTTLVLLETPSGIVMMTRGQLRDRVRDELAGLDLVGELLAERRATAATEDVA
jgi:AbrB family looped-hinge helix DNA binding protein